MHACVHACMYVCLQFVRALMHACAYVCIACWHSSLGMLCLYVRIWLHVVSFGAVYARIRACAQIVLNVVFVMWFARNFLRGRVW